MDSVYESDRHDWFHIGIVSLTSIIYIIYLIFNGISSSDNSSLFPNSQGEVSNLYFVDITPAAWVFILIWTTIFIWQFLWIIYSIIWIFRRTSDGSYLYNAIDVFDYRIYIGFLINNLLIIGWLFLWANLQVGWSLLLIVLAALSIHYSIIIALRHTYYNTELIKSYGLYTDLVLVRLFLINGLAFYLTWLSLATNLNFAIYISYHLSAKQEDAGTIALFFILALVVAYFILENIVFRKFFRYLFTPWVVLIIAISGSIDKNYTSNDPSRNDIILACLLSIILLLTLVKVVLFILYKTILEDESKEFEGE